jgi:hypothetical protein
MEIVIYMKYRWRKDAPDEIDGGCPKGHFS